MITMPPLPDPALAGALAGFVLLLGGGQLVVREAATLSARLGVPALIIGLVVVGFGTSAPELATGVRAALAGAPALAFGNVIGASVANLLVVLPLTALLLPVAVARAAIRVEGAVVIAAAALLAGIALVPVLARAGGIAALLLLGGWLGLALRQAAGLGAATGLQEREGRALVRTGEPWWRAMLLLVAGLVALVAGAELLVGGATRLATRLGVGQDLLGLTLLSLGTCLPELVTAIIAVRRRQTDIVVGNALGSCLFNLLAVGGVVAAISGTGPAGAAARFDAPMVLAAAMLVLAILIGRQKLGRAGALLLLAVYGGWLAFRLA